MFTKLIAYTFFILLFLFSGGARGQLRPSGNRTMVFYGDTLSFERKAEQVVDFDRTVLNTSSIEAFYQNMEQHDFSAVVKVLLQYKTEHKLSDWLYYQLVRKTAQTFSPKADNYERYTLYKWYLMCKSGYDAQLAVIQQKLLFYVYTKENIYDIPFFIKDKRQYMCLNYHDYGLIAFDKEILRGIELKIPNATSSFSYKINRLPDIKSSELEKKDLRFTYGNKTYNFKIDLNPDLQSIFTNYPVVDFESYLNIPLSRTTYNALIPALKEAVKDLSQKKGVDYLMQFTRNAFLYESDEEQFGKEKRFSPELTLFSSYSDCDDRVALFFYLVKEIYNLPMVVVLYPTHVTVAVGFDDPLNNSFTYKNRGYAICDPTPQQTNLPIGKISRKYKSLPYSIAYEYLPSPGN